MNRRAFSLVELLTCIAIIAVLGAILLPVISSVRESAHSASCRTNLRSLALAHQLYRQEFVGQPLPGFVTKEHPLSEGHKVWGIQTLRRYYMPGPDYIFSKSPTAFKYSSVEICPSAEQTETSFDTSDPLRGPDYGMLAREENYDLFYVRPSDTPLFWDGWNPVWNSSRRMPPRHNDGHGINVAFLDGSVENITDEDGRLSVRWWAEATTLEQPNDGALGVGGSLLSESR